MFRWVNTHTLPLAAASSHLLTILELLFSADEYDEDKIVWNPTRPGEGFRVLLQGRASVGGESRKDKTNGKRSGLRIKAREGGVIKGTA